MASGFSRIGTELLISCTCRIGALYSETHCIKARHVHALNMLSPNDRSTNVVEVRDGRRRTCLKGSGNGTENGSGRILLPLTRFYYGFLHHVERLISMTDFSVVKPHFPEMMMSILCSRPNKASNP